jgi:hypothetical protein
VTNPRFKPLLIGAIAVVAAWAITFAGFRIAAHLKMTPEKMAAALRATRLEQLDADARAKRLAELAAELNRLVGEDRRRARADREWDRLWREMTEQEKTEFIDRTMPTGVKQMLTTFEKLPEDRRRYAITNAIARMRERQENGEPASGERRNREPLSEELQKRMVATGLKTFYAESSAQTKAEVAPLLEEMQRMMESGRFFRR